MHLVCPGCGVTGSLECFSSDADARAATALAAALPAGLGPLVLRYIGLFRPQKRALAWRRVRCLVEQLGPLIQAGRITKRGREWLAPEAAWAAAIQQMLDMGDKLQRPLANHNYLLEILVGLADRTEAIAETEIERQRRAVVPHDASPIAAKPTPIETAAERMARMRREQEEADRRAALQKAVMGALKR